jgi:hypothetical protein
LGGKYTALIADKAKFAPEEQSKQYFFRSSAKKNYRSPGLAAYGTLADLIRFKINSREIYRDTKAQNCSSGNSGRTYSSWAY